ncbi:MAG TPA: glutamate-1-semialdehyde 2,1-aminomutase [Alphaproteobacteria bacterium]|nr:glutamate-1-semialdehyde 2,1-aminomutase [Alphaproteobacteria bacterium]
MTLSHELFARAQRVIPGGVNSPVRAFRGVGGEPVFIKRGAGPRLIDADDRQYVDYLGSWGAAILGHAHPAVVAAVKTAVDGGLGFGAPTEIEIRMADRLCRLIPSIDMVRMVNSGTEATMSAVRLARAYTGRDKILKFEGCYHGHSDSMLVKAGSGALTLGVPTSPGVPVAIAEHTITAPYNDLGQVEEIFTRVGGQIACVIVEPVAGNMNCVLPREGFLSGLRRLCDQYGSLLIFDEVITGFRVALGGAQQRFGVRPDLTTLGKIIGGGLPVGAFGGRREIMETVAPLGATYQAGTLSGNPLAMAAGVATLRALAEPGTYERLEQRAVQLCEPLVEAALAAGAPVTLNRVGAMMTLFFCAGPVRGFDDARRADTALYARWFAHLLERGVYAAPSQFEAAMVSLALTDDDVARVADAAASFFASL